MEKSGLLRAAAIRASSLVVFAMLAGCSTLLPQDPTPPPTPPPELPPVVEPEPEPVEPAPEPVAEPQPEPEPEPEPPANIEPLVAVVLSDRTPAYTGVAEALAGYLDNADTYDLSDRSLPARDAFAAIADSGASAVVAIGLPAARAARRFATVPVVIGQVFNVNDGELLSGDVKAVSVLPPMALYIDEWHKLDPSVRNVGAILGPGHDDLIAEADEALQARGVKFHYAVAQSDRETLYLFNRLVRDIDGFILFPDNRVLSRSVLVEMMSYASRHRVQMTVFNEPLLEYGAVFSAKTVEADIAAQIVGALDEAIRGDFASVPAISSLSEIEIRTNPEVLQKLGLQVPGEDVDQAVAEAQ
jgi:ABC-type uncharacterized transport system substrate-binding protein